MGTNPFKFQISGTESLLHLDRNMFVSVHPFHCPRHASGPVSFPPFQRGASYYLYIYPHMPGIYFLFDSLQPPPTPSSSSDVNACFASPYYCLPFDASRFIHDQNQAAPNKSDSAGTF